MSETKQQPTRTAPDLAALDAETIARELDWATAANGILTLRDHGESAAADALVLLAAQRDALSREVERLREQAVADEDAENADSCAQDTRIRELEQENAYLKADTPHYVWMLSDDSPFRRDPELFVNSAAAKAAAEVDYLTGNYADPASAIAEGDAVLEWVPILYTDAEQLLDGNGRTGLIVMRVQVKGRVDPVDPQYRPGAQAQRHFSPGYSGEIPDHLGAFETCPMPACATSRAQHEAAADIQQLTSELFADDTQGGA